MTPRRLALALGLTLGLGNAHAARFAYHGELLEGDAPAQGAVDLRLRSFANPGDTKALGAATEVSGVTLSDGRFSVEVDVPEDVDGMSWVEVAVRKAGSGDDYVVLGDPQPLAKVNSTCPGAWALDGNSGVPGGSYLGIADTGSTQTLDLHVQGRRGLRLQPNSIGNAVSVVAGHPNNTIAATALGGTIGGGGRDGLPNIVGENFGTVAGGSNNFAGNPFAGVGGQGGASVGGGESNFATGTFSTIPGGFSNVAAADQSFAAGTRAQVTASHTGTFVWADSQNGTFDSSGPNQFAIRASGGLRWAGSGLNSTTSPAFTHQANHASNTCDAGSGVANSRTAINHPLLNGRPDAIIVMTPNFGSTAGGGVAPPRNPLGVYYNAFADGNCGANRWVIYDLTTSPGTIQNGAKFNIWFVLP
jgi:hypothetical protein